MMNTPDLKDNIELPIEKAGTALGDLRVVDPKADAAMVRSIARYGQLSPVIVGQLQPGAYEIVDGFKRYRSCKKLGYNFLRARVMDGSVHVLKAAMIELNLRAHTIGDLEKAFVIRSMHRDDRLSQVQIAALLNRHKSWVCRRLSLAERLADEVLEYLRLGLISMTIGRELAKLPRGNQPGALKTLLKYRFTTAETTRLVAFLLTQPAYAHATVLNFPAIILEDRQPERPSRGGYRSVYDRLYRVEKLLRQFRDEDLEGFMDFDAGRVGSFIENVANFLCDIREKVNASEDCPVHSKP